MSTTTPTDLGPRGAALWDELTSIVGFDVHEEALLLEACRVRDRLDGPDAVVRAEGVTVATPQGVQAHPALKEARAQEIVFSRLLASLRIPDEDEVRPQRRGAARASYRRG